MNDYARELHTARKMGIPIEQLTASGAELTRLDAYGIQEKGINFRIEDGEKIVGMKIFICGLLVKSEYHMYCAPNFLPVTHK